MKILTKLTFIALTLIMVSCGGNEFNTFTDNENGFQIDYPIDWDTTNMDARMSFMAREDFKDSTDMFGEGFSVSVFDNQGVSLQSIVDENVKMTNLYFDNPEIKEEKFTNENGIDCIEIDVTYETSGLNLNNTAVFISNNNLLYTVTLSAEKHQKEAYQTLFDEIINSFNWTEK
ncbi:MAG: hypothetical protein GQ574_25060 [Crocinitomix sp.]|nr:hypothetical protein [Crocinitomix sp.]